MKKVSPLSTIITVTALLSGIAGYADAAGFVRLNSLFIAHVTGNLVVAGAEIVGQEHGIVWIRLVLIPVFMVAVSGSTILFRTFPYRLATFLKGEAFCFLLLTGLGVTLLPNPQMVASPPKMLLLGSLGALTMGIQNALVKEFLGALAQTTAMTGNLTQFTMDLSQRYFLTPKSVLPPQEQTQRLYKFGSAILGFFIGAILGVTLMKGLGFWSMVLPAIALWGLTSQVKDLA